MLQALSSLSSKETAVETDTKGQRKTREEKKGQGHPKEAEQLWKKEKKRKKAERRVKCNALWAVINTDGEADNPSCSPTEAAVTKTKDVLGKRECVCVCVSVCVSVCFVCEAALH